ncbi:MAG: radical SAM protein [Promethearchaeota archaeon]
MNQQFLIRASIGTAAVLGLRSVLMDTKPTTAYLMMYHPDGCTANCQFCPQARDSSGNKEKLSRVQWPKFTLNAVVKGLTASFHQSQLKRACLQVLNYPNNFRDITYILQQIHDSCAIPISLSCYPLSPDELQVLSKIGLQRIGIPLDGATEEIFRKVKGEEAGGPYTWDNQWRGLMDAVKVLGRGRVSTHLIIGLGETEKEAIQFIQRCIDAGILVGLFAFTPIDDTPLGEVDQPALDVYRRIQLVRYLMVINKLQMKDIMFGSADQIIQLNYDKKALLQIVKSGHPFETSGCPHCNRPYYNERPGGPLYNFPRLLTDAEGNRIWSTLKVLVND